MDIKSLITSSADPAKVSLFIKSIATFAVLFGVDSAIVEEGERSLTAIVTAIGMLISAFTALYGLSRKAVLGRWAAR